ncbi:autotransporter-associated beta strand repeat-containing protein [Luteolibacter soli]|uniref:Autotransporter-associated beta strand repeat-containing protein n=1 Tax=Luteolibacter soli TaxID=3135280 RepID=A0ABU9ATA2_9BACT
MKTLLALLFTALAVCANAGTHVWSGAGANAYWNTAGNWSSGGVPVAGEAAPVKLIFPANATSRTSMLNIANLKIDSIEVDLTSGSYTFPTAGTSITFTGAAGDNFKVTGNSSSVTWQPGINLQSTCRFNVLVSPAYADFQGVISGNGGIVKTGNGDLKFSIGAVANTFTGTLRLEQGDILLEKAAGIACFGGKLEIVAGTCTVRQSQQIPANAVVEILGGTLAAAGNTTFTQTLNNVTMGGDSRINANVNGNITFGGTLDFVNDATTSPTISTASTGTLSFGGGTRTLYLPHPDSYLEVYAVIGDGPTATSLVKTGAGYLKLLSANTFSGTMEVKEGELDIANPNGLGSTAKGTTVRAGATLILNSTMTLPAGETITLEGDLEPAMQRSCPARSCSAALHPFMPPTASRSS